MATPDFIRLNGEAVRLTSLKRTEEGDRMTAVVMLRGMRDHERLVDLLGRSPVTVEILGEAPRAMAVTRNGFTSTGEGPRALFRHVIELDVHAETAPPQTDTFEDRLARIEEKLDRILDLLQRA